MKILLLTDGIFPFTMGGMQKHSYFLAKYFSLSNVKVEVVHCSDNMIKDELSFSEFDDFNQSEVSFKHFTFPKLDSLPGHYLRESKAYSHNLYEFYKDKLSEFDAIYAQGFTAWSFIKKSVKIPIFINFHGYEMFQKAPSIRVKVEHLMLRSAVKYISRSADYVFSFGGIIGEVLNQIRVPSNKTIECPIGIEEDWLNGDELISNNPRKFVFIGRYERRKGVEELSNAILKLDKSYKAEFHFIGPISKQYQVNDERIKYYGSISDPSRIKEVLRSSDVLVCPSYSEGMPTVIMEAMASGLAVLTTNVGAISKQVSSKNGVVLKEPEVNSLIEALQTFITMPNESLIEMKKVSLFKVKEEFLWSKVIKYKLNEISKRIK